MSSPSTSPGGVNQSPGQSPNMQNFSPGGGNQSPGSANAPSASDTNGFCQSGQQMTCNNLQNDPATCASTSGCKYYSRCNQNMCGGSSMCKAQQAASGVCNDLVSQASKLLSNSTDYKLLPNQVNSTINQCLAFSTTSVIDLTVAGALDTPQSVCNAHSDLLCDASTSGVAASTTADCSGCVARLSMFASLVQYGHYAMTNADLTQFCMEVKRYGNYPEQLTQVLNMQFGCTPGPYSDCCLATEPNSYLAKYGILGLRPAGDQCTALPGCQYQTNCWLDQNMDNCNAFTNVGGKAACAAGAGCVWEPRGYDPSAKLGGRCYNGTAQGQCQLAGQMGGAQGCLAVKDSASNLPICQAQKDCRIDWDLMCDRYDQSCCLSAANARASNATAQCSALSSGDHVCTFDQQCRSKGDSCNLWVTSRDCEASPTKTCIWRVNTYSGNSQGGFCSSVRDTCNDHSNDVNACQAAAGCKVVPKCHTSYCDPTDACCPIKDDTTCLANPNCSIAGYCQLDYDECQNKGVFDCNGNCQWDDGSHQCSLAQDPCAQFAKDPVGCSSTQSSKGLLICSYQSSCFDKCRDCRGCLANVLSFVTDVYPSYANGTKSMAQLPQPAGGAKVTDAQFSDDATEIWLTLSTTAHLTSTSPADVFKAATAALFGAKAYLYIPDGNKAQLRVALGGAPTVDLNSVLSIKAGSALVDLQFNAPFAAGDLPGKVKGSTAASKAVLQLTATASNVVANLAGPSGDVLDTDTISFSAAKSQDPDDPTNARSGFRYSWTCTRYDTTFTTKAPCFKSNVNANTTNNGAGYSISPGFLTASDDFYYQFQLTVAKGTGLGQRTDMASTTVRVRSTAQGIPPAGTAIRSCIGGTCPKKHSPTQPLRLAFTPQVDTDKLTYAWWSPNLALTASQAASGIDKRNLLVRPVDASGNAVFVDGASLTFYVNVTNTDNNLKAMAQVSVMINRRPVCAATDALDCLRADKATGRAVLDPFTVSANYWTADGVLTYSFGVQDAFGNRDFYIKNSQNKQYTFSGLRLPGGANQADVTLFVCVRDDTNAETCATTSVTLTAAAVALDTNTLNSLSSDLGASLASGDSNAILSSARRLSSVTSAVTVSSNTSDAQTASLIATTGSMVDALSALVGTDTGSAVDPQTALAVAGALASVTSAVDSAELGPVLDTLGNFIGSPASGTDCANPQQRRRLLQDAISAVSTSKTAVNQMQKLTGTADNVITVASVGKLVGEAPTTVGSGEVRIVTAQLSYSDLSGLRQSVFSASDVSQRAQQLGLTNLGRKLSQATVSSSIGSTTPDVGDPAVTVPSEFSKACAADTRCPATIGFQLTYYADASLLENTLGGANYLVSGVSGAKFVSGYMDVSFVGKIGAGNLGGQMLVVLPLNSNYNPGMVTICLRVDPTTGVLRGYPVDTADIYLQKIANNAAYCRSSYLGQILVAQYVPPPPPPALAYAPGYGPTPSPSTSQSPSIPTDSAGVATTPAGPPAMVPLITFTATLPTYTIATFDASAQTAYTASIQTALKASGASASVSIAKGGITAGSVNVKTEVVFLDGNSTAASAFQIAIATAPNTYISVSTFGAVTVAQVTYGQTNNPAETGGVLGKLKKLNIGAIAGGVIGGVALLTILIGAAVVVRKRQRANQPAIDHARLPSTTGPNTPAYPQPQTPGSAASAPPMSPTAGYFPDQRVPSNAGPGPFASGRPGYDEHAQPLRG
ncbi:hypothetical protein WJX72_012550 [[Myrmecia] bisecta]|uniref:PKD/REJ-like domain-containing protein n=1 Tax=[Myrmecia] bisecta TaxID=41462 RepID=A0AAW1QBD1_9CHLO